MPIWRNRDFMLLWAAQAISQTAHNAVHYGLLVLVQKTSHSSAHMSVAVLTVILPSVIFGLVAGAYVDRRDKSWVLIGTNALRAVVMLGFILFADYLALVYLTTFVFSTISQFFAPAEAAMIPKIVERRRLLQANSLFHVTFTASQLAGLVIVGPLVVNLVGLDGLFIAVALAFGLCAAILWPLPSTHRRVANQIQGFAALWTEIREVLGVVRADRALAWAVSHWTLGATLALIIAALAPGYVVEVLGIRAEDSIFVLAPAGVGMVLGAAVLSRWGPGLDRVRVVGLGTVLTGLALVFLGLVPSQWAASTGTAFGPDAPSSPADWGLIGVVMLAALAAGLAFVAIVVPSQTLIQERSPEEIRGRIFAVQMVLSNVVSILPLVFLGDLADRIGIEWTLLGVGAAVGLFAVGGARAARTLERGRDDRAVEPGAA